MLAVAIRHIKRRDLSILVMSHLMVNGLRAQCSFLTLAIQFHPGCVFTDKTNIAQMTSLSEEIVNFLAGRECPFPGIRFPLWNNVPGRARAEPRGLRVPCMLLESG